MPQARHKSSPGWTAVGNPGMTGHIDLPPLCRRLPRSACGALRRMHFVLVASLHSASLRVSAGPPPQQQHRVAGDPGPPPQQQHRVAGDPGLRQQGMDSFCSHTQVPRSRQPRTSAVAVLASPWASLIHPSNRNIGAHCHPRLRKSSAIREPWCWGPRYAVPAALCLTDAQCAAQTRHNVGPVLMFHYETPIGSIGPGSVGILRLGRSPSLRMTEARAFASLASAVEDVFREIALGGVGNDGYYALPFP